MSIYSQLLSAALERTDGSEDEPTTGDALASLLACRSKLENQPAKRTGSDWAAAALADQLAYDIALIGLAQRLDIDFDLDRFDQRQLERSRLERALAGRGLGLDQLIELEELTERS
jgi:hypothetical protein